jgi:hypothetical protein
MEIEIWVYVLKPERKRKERRIDRRVKYRDAREGCNTQPISAFAAFSA